jgi:hypothetical protein
LSFWAAIQTKFSRFLKYFEDFFLFLSDRKNEKKNIADFHVLVLFMAKQPDLSDKKKIVRNAPLPFVKICTTPTAFSFQFRKLKFWLP